MIPIMRLWREYHGSAPAPCHCTRQGARGARLPATEEVHVDPLFKATSAQLLYCKVVLCDERFRGRYCECVYSVPSQLIPCGLTDSCRISWVVFSYCHYFDALFCSTFGQLEPLHWCLCLFSYVPIVSKCKCLLALLTQ